MAEPKVKTGKEITVVHFINAINIGGIVSSSAEGKKHRAVFDKTATGLTISIPGSKFPSRWVPDAQIKWVEFSE